MKKMAALLVLMLALMSFAIAEDGWTGAVLADPEVSGRFPYHCLADVGGDGGSVLIVSTTEDAFIGAEDFARVYLRAEDGPRLALEAGGNGGEVFYVNRERHTLTHFSRFSGEGHIAVYEVGDGALTLVTRVDSYGPFHDPAGDSAEPAYYQDGQAISEEACTGLFAEYAGDADALRYE